MVDSKRLGYLNQGARTRVGARARTRGPRGVALSFIRTVTVGPGIAPDLLTPRLVTAGARGLERRTARLYRRWGLPPRPENAAGTKAPATAAYAMRQAPCCRRDDNRGALAAVAAATAGAGPMG